MEGPPNFEEEVKIESEKNTGKEIIWMQKLKELDELGDRLGMGLDAHIKEAVAAFNVNGFHTNQSCEGGHDEQSLGAPWVSIEAPDGPEERYVGEKEVYQDVAKRYEVTEEDVRRANNKEAWLEAIKLVAKNDETTEYKNWKAKSLEMHKMAKSLLKEFYENRDAKPAVKLKLENVSKQGTFRIHNGGKDYDTLLQDMSEKQKNGLSGRLTEYQAEMKAFSEFLKDKFLKG